VLLTVEGLHVPVMPLVDVVGRGFTPAGKAEPLHIVSDVPKLNTGAMFGFTVTVNVAGVPHCDGLSGVKVYTPLEVLLTVDGLHVPVIPLVDVLGNGFIPAGNAAPLQIVNEVPKLNTGVTSGFTVTVNVAGVPHCDGLSGVKVYTPLEVLLTVDGLHVPVMPLVDVLGNGFMPAGKAAPLQIVNEVPKLNTGVTSGFTVTVNVAVVPHCAGLLGVNV
jgi:hypothetical protein